GDLHLLGDEQPAAAEPPLLGDEDAGGVAQAGLLGRTEERVVADVPVEERGPPDRERPGEQPPPASRAEPGQQHAALPATAAAPPAISPPLSSRYTGRPSAPPGGLAVTPARKNATPSRTRPPPRTVDATRNRRFGPNTSSGGPNRSDRSWGRSGGFDWSR